MTNEENKCLTEYKKLFCTNCEADCTTSILDCNGYQFFNKGYEQGVKSSCEVCEKASNIEYQKLFDKQREIISELKADKEWLDNTNNQQTEVILELQKQIDQLSNDNHVLKTAFITQKDQIEYLNSEILQMRCPGNCNNANSEKCSSSCYDCEYYEYND